jgi:hypothetical protein
MTRQECAARGAFAVHVASGCPKWHGSFVFGPQHGPSPSPTVESMAAAFRNVRSEAITRSAFRAVMAASRKARGDDDHERAKAGAMTAAFGSAA